MCTRWSSAAGKCALSTLPTCQNAAQSHRHASQPQVRDPHRRKPDLLLDGKEFAKHRTVNHSKDEYFKEGAGVQSAEAFFSLLQRGVYGCFHSVSEAHLQRYCDEFAFRWNNRSSLGIEDAERAADLLKGNTGKRLTYRRTDEAKDA